MPKEFPDSPKGFHPFGELIGLEFTAIGDGRSRCELQVKKEFFNPHGVLHGGVVYAMADTGMGGALYSMLAENELCTTVEIKIAYFTAVKSGKLVCDTRVIERRSRIAIMESEVASGDKLVAKALGTFYIYETK
jgi:acyl-CoA thioesterase